MNINFGKESSIICFGDLFAICYFYHKERHFTSSNEDLLFFSTSRVVIWTSYLCGKFSDPFHMHRGSQGFPDLTACMFSHMHRGPLELRYCTGK